MDKILKCWLLLMRGTSFIDVDARRQELCLQLIRMSLKLFELFTIQ